MLALLLAVSQKRQAGEHSTAGKVLAPIKEVYSLAESN
jgi:hypothetical protein